MRAYKYLDSGKADAHPANSTRALIGSVSDVIDWFTRTGQDSVRGEAVRATFIIDTDGWLWIADRHSEHVACAAGRDVLSAGEMTFETNRQTQVVVVSAVTNQSAGYCPEPESWPVV